MRVRPLFSALLLFGLAGCSTSTSNPVVSTALRTYNGTASVGDFLSITIDPAAKTMTYTDVSNGESGAVPYTANADGTYTLNDPNHNLLAAYEVPNYALLVQANKAGPNQDMPALITAVLSGQISLATWEGHTYNYMQFRTSAGGAEIGSVVIGATGAIHNSSYWPYGAINGSNAFNSGNMDASAALADPSGTFLKMPETNGGATTYDFVFGTANGIFAVDSANGAILGLAQASNPAFDASFAGTYHAIYYEKIGATTGQGNLEVGAPDLGNATMIVTGAGQITVEDATGKVLVQETALIPVADASYLYGASGQLENPCWGLFTFRVTNGSTQQDVFVSFLDHAILFSSFKTAVPMQPGNSYDYLYGVGVR